MAVTKKVMKTTAPVVKKMDNKVEVMVENATQSAKKTTAPFFKTIKNDEMLEFAKKVLYTGVGLVATNVEKVQTSLVEFIQNEKDAQKEGKRIVDNLIKSTENTKEEVESKVNEVIEKVMGSFQKPSNEVSISRLEKRIAELEQQLAKTAKLGKN